MASPFDEEFSEDELAEIKKVDDIAPPKEDGEAEIVDADATPVVEPAPVVDLTPAADDDFATFAEQHKGKTPEELLKIAHDQSKRAAKAGFEARKSTQSVEDMRTRARQVVEDRKAKTAASRDEFGKLLESDPDAATKALADRLFDADEQAAQTEAETLENEAAITEALEFAGQYIPDLHIQAPKMFEVATDIGFDADEVRGITDGRQLVALHLAQLGKIAIVGGLIDTRGNLIQQAGNSEPTDPRLKAPAPMTTAGSTGGGTPPARPNGARALQDALLLSDKEFDALSDDDLEKMFAAA